MRIAFYGFRRGTGGIPPYLVNLMNSLAGLGAAVDLVLPFRGEMPEGLSPIVRCIELGAAGWVPRAFALSRYLKKAEPHAALSVRERGNRELALAAALSRVRTALVFRVGMPSAVAISRRPFHSRIGRLLSMRWAYRKAHLVIANTERVKEDVIRLTGLPPERARVLPNPTVSPFLFEKAEEMPRHPWLREKAGPVILGVGRLARQKGFDVLLKAVSLLRTEGARLLVIGEGKERDALERLASRLGLAGRVSFPGYIPSPYPEMKAADVFVLSSRWEGLPNVLIEAMALGTPVAAADCPSGPREILDGGRYGPLAPPEDPSALARAVDALLKNPTPRDLLREGALRYSAERAARMYLEAIQGILRSLR